MSLFGYTFIWARSNTVPHDQWVLLPSGPPAGPPPPGSDAVFAPIPTFSSEPRSAPSSDPRPPTSESEETWPREYYDATQYLRTIYNIKAGKIIDTGEAAVNGLKEINRRLANGHQPIIKWQQFAKIWSECRGNADEAIPKLIRLCRNNGFPIAWSRLPPSEKLDRYQNGSREKKRKMM